MIDKTSYSPPVIIFLCRIKVYTCNWRSTWILSGQFQCIAIHVLDTLDDLLLHRHSYIQLLDTYLPPPHGDIWYNNFDFDLSIYVHFTFGNLNIIPQEMWVVRCCLRQLPHQKYAAYSYWLVTSFSIPGNWYSCLVEMCNQAELFFMSSFTVSIILDLLPILVCTFCSRNVALLLQDACDSLSLVCICAKGFLCDSGFDSLIAFAVDSHTNTGAQSFSFSLPAFVTL